MKSFFRIFVFVILVWPSWEASAQRKFPFFEPEFDYDYCKELSLYNHLIPDELIPVSYQAFVSRIMQKKGKDTLLIREFAPEGNPREIKKSVYVYLDGRLMLNTSETVTGYRRIEESTYDYSNDGSVVSVNYSMSEDLPLIGNPNKVTRIQQFTYNTLRTHLIRQSTIEDRFIPQDDTFRKYHFESSVEYHYDNSNRLYSITTNDISYKIQYEDIHFDPDYPLWWISKFFYNDLKGRNTLKVIKISSVPWGDNYIFSDKKSVGQTCRRYNETTKTYDSYVSYYEFNGSGKLQYLHLDTDESPEHNNNNNDKPQNWFISRKRGKGWQGKEVFYASLEYSKVFEKGRRLIYLAHGRKYVYDVK